MTGLPFIIYNSLLMPIDICNIILSYAKFTVKQVYKHGLLRNECDNILYECHDTRTIGIINYDMYHIKIDSDNANKINIYNDLTQTTIYLSAKAYAIKYSDKLVCEHYDHITIYDINVIDGAAIIQCTKNFNTRNILLLYVDDNIIITRFDYRDVHGMHIYNYNFDLCKEIHTNHRIEYVSLDNDILSYSMLGQYYPIEL